MIGEVPVLNVGGDPNRPCRGKTLLTMEPVRPVVDYVYGSLTLVVG